MAHFQEDWVELNRAASPGRLPSPDGRTRASSRSPPPAAPPSSSADTKLGLTVVANDESIMVTVSSPEGAVRTPTDVCCIIDISGSMGSDANLKNAAGEVESYGLTQLDVVKHAVKTVIATLGEGDRLSVVAFDDKAVTIFELKPMDTQSAKNKATADVEALELGNSTNLWDGLETGLEVLRHGSSLDRNRAIMLLTDGLPNVSPPRGELGTLKNYLDKHSFSATIYTFGFGYSLDSPLLDALAVAGNGTFAFIPESSMVATIFVNSLANILSAAGTQAALSLEFLNGAKLRGGGSSLGHTQFTDTKWGVNVSLGNVNYGQSRTILVPVIFPVDEMPVASRRPYVNVGLVYHDCSPAGAAGSAVEVRLLDCSTKTASEPEEVEREMGVQALRIRFVEDVLTGHIEAKNGHLEKAKETVAALCEAIRSSPLLMGNPFVQGLLLDAEGQVAEAVAKEDQFARWGKHYLPSLARAHLMQVCNNFKDPGVQFYGGKLFRTIQEEADEIFRGLPAPKPSRAPSTYARGGVACKAMNLSSMSSYHNACRPCFDGNNTVVMASDGGVKRLKDLKKGDRVLGGVKDQGNAAAERSTTAGVVTVTCMVRTPCPAGKEQLVQFEGGMRVTPYHPILLLEGDVWVFPCEVEGQEIRELDCEAVYSFVLEQGGHGMLINGIQGISLGHGLEHSEVVKHEYFGTQRVVEDLRRLEGWEEGLVELQPGWLKRADGSRGRIVSMHKPAHAFSVNNTNTAALSA